MKAHASDSVLAAVAVSRDHKPDQTDERQRIEDAGGFVMWAGKKTDISTLLQTQFLLFGSILNAVWLD